MKCFERPRAALGMPMENFYLRIKNYMTSLWELLLVVVFICFVFAEAEAIDSKSISMLIERSIFMKLCDSLLLALG